MITVSIIGTAGRKDDKDRWTAYTYDTMYEYARTVIKALENVTLVSGGAALADHLAVQLYLDRTVDHLVLHMPAPFEDGKFTQLTNSWKDPGRVANYYHRLFSEKMGYNTLLDIRKAIKLGAEVHTYRGFFVRNAEVAKSDIILAFTYGPHNGTDQDARKAGLKDGGTAHTWNLSKSDTKIHISINQLENNH